MKINHHKEHDGRLHHGHSNADVNFHVQRSGAAVVHNNKDDKKT